MFCKILRVLFFLMFILTSAGIFSQSQISGKVLDAQGALPGATVSIQNTQRGTTSSFDGDFVLFNVPVGDIVVVISYIGYQSREISVRTMEGERTDLGTIILEEDKYLLDEFVVVSAYRPSQARALNIKKASLNIAEVIAADAIGKLPDRNAAEAVQRIQGVTIARDLGEGRFVSVRGTPVQWSSATLNGNRLPSASGDFANRGIQFDIFPSELIQYVKLAKALTPDMDGDAIGGSIDFITKSAPYETTLTFTGAGGYTVKTDAPSYNGSIVYGDKINDKLRFITSAVVWDRSAGSDNHRIIFDFNNPDPDHSYSFNQFQIRDYNTDRRTIGLNAALDYQLNDNNRFYIKSLYSEYMDHQTVLENYFNIKQNNLQIQNRHAIYVTDLYSIQLGGESQLSDLLKLDWSLTNARSSFKFDSPDNLPRNQRGYPIVNFMQQGISYGNLSSDGLRYLQMDSPNGVGDSGDKVLPHLNTAIDPNQAYLNQIILARNNNDETDYRGQFDFIFDASNKMEIKAGASLLNKQKNINSSVLVWMPMSALGIPQTPMIFMSDLERRNYPFNDGFFPELNNPFDDVLVNPLTNNQIDQIYEESFLEQAMTLQLLNPESSSNLTSSYTGTENVYAVYAMGTYHILDNLQLIAGIRNEYNDITFKGKEVISTDEGDVVSDLVQDNSYNAFLPSLHLRYVPMDNTIFRLAYSRSFARPDFSDLNPSTIVSEITRTITQGNTQLKPTFSNNLDLMVEHYLDNVGIITAGAFYKDLSNVIYRNQSLVLIDGETYLKSNPDNIQDASVLGFETGLSKRFTELPGFLGNLGLEGNYTYIDSRVELPQFENGELVGAIQTTLPQQAKHIFNVILFYEVDRFMLRLAGNYKGKYLNTIRTSAGPEHYEWFDKNFTIDLSSSYSINSRLRLFLELNNITNEANRFYHGTPERIENLWYFGFRGQAGLTYNLF